MNEATYRAKKAAWNRAYRARKGISAKEARTPTASVISYPNASGVVFVAQVREIDGHRTYLSRWPTREDAMAACETYIATGARPLPAKSGPRIGQKKRAGSMTRWGTPVLLDPNTPAKPLPTAERLARLQAKGVPVSIGRPAPSNTPETRLEMIRRIARRLA